jgi:uncharacterized damage-inducible protein DinB
MMANTPEKPNGKIIRSAAGHFCGGGTRKRAGFYNRWHAEESMTTYLNELYWHQEWADAEQWRAFEAYPAALADRAIRERLHHIHVVQSAFLWVVEGQKTKFIITKVEDYANMADLKAFAWKYHAEMAAMLRAMDEARLAEVIEVPWFQPPLKISVRHALTQAAMHSHYHRGQNATRLRELGGVPPGTDLIEWLRLGQPAARWE